MDASLYGRSLDEAEPHLGSLAQAVRCESYVLSGGPSAGARRIRLTVGPIDVELLPDRGLDIGAVRFAGEAVAWLGPTGLPTRRSVDDFAQTFGGGLLTTCGLLNYGPAVTVDGEAHPMHGRYSTLPAEVHRAEAARSGAVVEATVTEARSSARVSSCAAASRFRWTVGGSASQTSSRIGEREASPRWCSITLTSDGRLSTPAPGSRRERQRSCRETLPLPRGQRAGTSSLS